MLLKSSTSLIFLSAICHYHAFQIAPPSPLRTTSVPPRSLFPHAHTPSINVVVPKKIPPLRLCRHNSMENDADASIRSPNNGAIAHVKRKLSKIFNIKSAPLFLSLSIFLLLAFPDAARAVQSGGRMGGSFGGGGNRHSSSRSYNSPSRGSSYSRGSSGRSSRPSTSRSYSSSSTYSGGSSQGRSRQFDSRSRTDSARSSYSRDLGQESGRRSSSHTDSAPSGYSRDPSRGYSGGGVRPNLMRRGFGGGYARGGFGGGYARGMSPFYR